MRVEWNSEVCAHVCVCVCVSASYSLAAALNQSVYVNVCIAHTVWVVDSGGIPSLPIDSLKVYSMPSSSSEPEIPNTGPLDPRPKLRVEQCSGPCQQTSQGVLCNSSNDI